jgi:uncharacterized surface protein with fasciclin (FAS1) repeats
VIHSHDDEGYKMFASATPQVHPRDTQTPQVTITTAPSSVLFSLLSIPSQVFKMRTSFTLALTALASTTLAQTLSDVLASQPDLSTLASALGLVPDLAKTVSGLKDITILAPTNDAFKGLNANGPEAFAIKNKDRDVISQLLSYHVINGTFGSKDFTKIPTYVNSLLMQGNVTAGQNMGLVLNGDKAAILSGQLQYCSVVQAVC